MIYTGNDICYEIIKSCGMETDYSDYDLASLKALYEREARNLRNKLLNGNTWEDVQEERRRMTKIASVLYKRSALWSGLPGDYVPYKKIHKRE